MNVKKSKVKKETTTLMQDYYLSLVRGGIRRPTSEAFESLKKWLGNLIQGKS